MESSDSLAVDSPGARLRAAREALGVSPREMADRLNWVPAHVAAIEENRFEALRGAAFVRGYLRAYAKALNLDEDEIVAGYAAMQPRQAETPSPAPSSMAASGQKTGWSVLFGIVVSVAIIAGIWWKQQTSELVKPAPRAAPEQEAPAPASAPDSAAEPSRPDSSAALSTDAMVAPEATVDDAGGEPESAPQAVTEPAAPAAAATELAVVDGTAELLEFEFSDDCWLEVRDGDEQLIHADLHGAGDRFALDGKPPFRILAGNAAAVALSFRGEPVEVVTRPGRDSARFTVGQP